MHFLVIDQLGITRLYDENNIRPNEATIRWRALVQWKRDDYTRRAKYGNEAEKKEKSEKDRMVAEYPHKCPMGPTDPHSFR